MFFKRKYLFQQSFTIIEVVFAIFILTVGIVGVSTLVTQTITATSVSSQNLIAAYLAQEGIEIVRNIRDTNWIQSEYAIPPATSSWNDGLDNGDWEADYRTSTFSPTDFEDCIPTYNCDTYTGDFLNIDLDGLYSYDPSGTQTAFQRKITITSGLDVNGFPILNVKALLEWEERGRAYSIEVQENLYNWR